MEGVGGEGGGQLAAALMLLSVLLCLVPFIFRSRSKQMRMVSAGQSLALSPVRRQQDLLHCIGLDFQ